ncbi:MAG: hypothetical protein RR623_00935 [Bacilli bacterium]
MNSEREIYEQLKKMAINEAVASSGKDCIARNVGFQIDKIIDLALTLSANRQGYKLVPVEPTQNMIDKAVNDTPETPSQDYWHDSQLISDDQAISCYKAMIGEETK